MQTLKHSVLILTAAASLVVPAGALGATARPAHQTTIPAQYARVLAAAFGGLPAGEAQLMIAAVANAPFATQGAVVSQLARLSPASLQTMDAVLAATFQGMNQDQSRSFADTIVG